MKNIENENGKIHRYRTHASRRFLKYLCLTRAYLVRLGWWSSAHRASTIQEFTKLQQQDKARETLAATQALKQKLTKQEKEKIAKNPNAVRFIYLSISGIFSMIFSLQRKVFSLRRKVSETPLPQGLYTRALQFFKNRQVVSPPESSCGFIRKKKTLGKLL